MIPLYNWCELMNINYKSFVSAIETWLINDNANVSADDIFVVLNVDEKENTAIVMNIEGAKAKLNFKNSFTSALWVQEYYVFEFWHESHEHRTPFKAKDVFYSLIDRGDGYVINYEFLNDPRKRYSNLTPESSIKYSS